jgi:hypothetical protein
VSGCRDFTSSARGAREIGQRGASAAASPNPPQVHRNGADDRLPSLVHMHMLNAHELRAAVSEASKKLVLQAIYVAGRIRPDRDVLSIVRARLVVGGRCGNSLDSTSAKVQAELDRNANAKRSGFPFQNSSDGTV